MTAPTCLSDSAARVDGPGRDEHRRGCGLNASAGPAAVEAVGRVTTISPGGAPGRRQPCGRGGGLIYFAPAPAGFGRARCIGMPADLSGDAHRCRVSSPAAGCDVQRPGKELRTARGRRAGRPMSGNSPAMSPWDRAGGTTPFVHAPCAVQPARGATISYRVCNRRR